MLANLPAGVQHQICRNLASPDKVNLALANRACHAMVEETGLDEAELLLRTFQRAEKRGRDWLLGEMGLQGDLEGGLYTLAAAGPAPMRPLARHLAETLAKSEAGSDDPRVERLKRAYATALAVDSTRAYLLAPCDESEILKLSVFNRWFCPESPWSKMLLPTFADLPWVTDFEMESQEVVDHLQPIFGFPNFARFNPAVDPMRMKGNAMWGISNKGLCFLALRGTHEQLSPNYSRPHLYLDAKEEFIFTYSCASLMEDPSLHYEKGGTGWIRTEYAIGVSARFYPFGWYVNDSEEIERVSLALKRPHDRPIISSR